MIDHSTIYPGNGVTPVVWHSHPDDVPRGAAEHGQQQRVPPPDLVRQHPENKTEAEHIKIVKLCMRAPAGQKSEHHERVNGGLPDVAVAQEPVLRRHRLLHLKLSPGVIHVSAKM